MEITQTDFPDLVLVQPKKFTDNRGWFYESWNEREIDFGWIQPKFVQDNHSFSAKRGTIRGMHYQSPPHQQAKLIRCTSGSILDVVVDIRLGSPTKNRCFSYELTAENSTQLFVPEGFLHGFLTLEDNTEIQYKCTNFYASAADNAVRWDSIGFGWPLSAPPFLSDKDAAAPPLSSLPKIFWYEGDL